MSFIRTYIHPLRSAHLTVTYLSLFLGLLGQSYLFVYLAIDMAKLGYQAVVTYYEAWLLTGGLILFPALFYIFKYGGRRVFVGSVIALELIGAAVMLMCGQHTTPLVMGLIVATFGTGYWQMHHLNIAGHTSGDARGFEVSLAKVIGQIGGIAGSAIAGFSMAYGSAMHTAGAAFALIFIATVGLTWTLPRVREQDAKSDTDDRGSIIMENLWQVIKSHPRQNVATFCEAVYEIYMSMIMPVWLTLMGVAGYLVGITKMLQACVTALFAPMSGHAIHAGKGDEFKIAATTGALGSLPMLAFGPALVPLLTASFLWGVSRLMFLTGLESRWYSRRSATQVLSREIVLTLGRVVSVPAIAWVAFHAPLWYMPLGVALSLAVWPAGRYLMASTRESAL